MDQYIVLEFVKSLTYHAENPPPPNGGDQKTETRSGFFDYQSKTDYAPTGYVKPSKVEYVKSSKTVEYIAPKKVVEVIKTQVDDYVAPTYGEYANPVVSVVNKESAYNTYAAKPSVTVVKEESAYKTYSAKPAITVVKTENAYNAYGAKPAVTVVKTGNAYNSYAPYGPGLPKSVPVRKYLV